MSKISVENLSVKFKIYHDRSPSIKESFANIFKPNKQASHSEFIALNNVSFTINDGDRVGIIGHNGAGKSTILKAICRVYESDYGCVTVDGRIAPLLEIGAGFHPEFTGRENIYLNGSILGYSEKQMKIIEPEVIEFSELQDFIDTPVKYYSTGMYMRLAFALATSINPDILILDEVFAGGDSFFVKKAKMRMLEIIHKANIMVMVSHDPELIRSLCNRVIMLDHGVLVDDGPVDIVLNKYLSGVN